MEFPVRLPLGPVSIPLHTVFEVLAYTVAYRFYTYLRRHQLDLISEQDRLWIFVGAAAGGFFGSHLVGLLERPADLAWSNLVLFMTNKTIVGGLVGGLIGVEWMKKRIGVRTSSGDLMTYPLILGLALGRVGCFLEGLEDGTYGLPTALPWGIDFGDGLRRHPTQLYEIIFLGTLAAGLVSADRYTLERIQKLANGRRFQLFLSTYLLFRLLVDFIKPAPFTWLGLTTIQWTCVGGLIYYVLLWVNERLRPVPSS